MPTGTRIHRILIAVVATAMAAFLFAAEEAPGLATAEVESWGTVLVDGRGHSLYAYTEDETAESGFACVDACADNWIPLLADSVEELALGEGVDPASVDVRERPDGSSQVTYGGRPLYTVRRDTQPGHTRGQGLGGQFYLLSTDGELVTEELEGEAVEVDEATFQALMDEGGTLFARNCVACHGAEGQGVVGPPLDGMAELRRARFLINTIIVGRPQHGMPAFGPVLSDTEIAAIATYVRNSWSNDFGPVREEDVADVR